MGVLLRLVQGGEAGALARLLLECFIALAQWNGKVGSIAAGAPDCCMARGRFCFGCCNVVVAVRSVAHASGSGALCAGCGFDAGCHTFAAAILPLFLAPPFRAAQYRMAPFIGIPRGGFRQLSPEQGPRTGQRWSLQGEAVPVSKFRNNASRTRLL